MNAPNNPLPKSGGEPPHSKALPPPIPWPHAPTHQLADSGTYFVTVGTYRKAPLFREPSRLTVLQRGLLTVAEKFGWQLEAWCVLSNHYHFVGHSPNSGAETLSVMLRELHRKLAIWLNRLDATPGRQCWDNYWDTLLTHQRSYFARLNYTHQNAVHHHLAPVANLYEWCSAAWFERAAPPAQVRTIYSFKTDRLNVHDDF